MTDQPDFFGGGGQVQGSGYAGDPGRGPDGETCGSCAHCTQAGYGSRTYYKCVMGRVTASAETDIRLKTAACQHWEPDCEQTQENRARS